MQFQQIRPRKVRHDFDPKAIPKHWLGDDPVATHILNGVSLLFPVGERFFVRSVYRYRDQIRHDEVLDAQVRGFAGQEGHHSHEHERHIEMLRAQGYEVDDFLRRYERSLRWMERMLPQSVSLAATTASEHYTAIMAEQLFLDGAWLELAHPVMRDLLRWHATEEIEHKAVAFDVFSRVSGNYLVRLAGLSTSTAMLAYWWYRGTMMLLAQDGWSRRDVRRHIEVLREQRRQSGGAARSIGRDVFARGIGEYLRPGFHPNDNDMSHLIADVVAELDQPTREAA